MDDWALIFLGVIALSSFVQGAFLVGLALKGLELSKRVREMQSSVEAEIQPVLDNFERVSRNMTEVSEIASAQARRASELASETMERVEEAREQVRSATQKPLSSLRNVGALIKGLRRGLEVYQRLGGIAAQGRGSSRRYGGDEHLFI